MRSRSWLWNVLAPILLMGGLLALCVAWNPFGPTQQVRAGYEALRGRTETEVRALKGTPVFTFPNAEAQGYPVASYAKPRTRAFSRCLAFHEGYWLVYVFFNGHGRVFEVEWMGS